MKITISGRTVELHFGYPSFKSFIQGITLLPGVYQDGEGNFTPNGVAYMAYTAHENYCMNAKKAPTVTLDEVSQWVDETITGDSKDIIAKVIEEWAASATVKKFVEDAEKKSQLAAKSTSTESNQPVTERLESVPGS